MFEPKLFKRRRELPTTQTIQLPSYTREYGSTIEDSRFSSRLAIDQQFTPSKPARTPPRLDLEDLPSPGHGHIVAAVERIVHRWTLSAGHDIPDTGGKASSAICHSEDTDIVNTPPHRFIGVKQETSDPPCP